MLACGSHCGRNRMRPAHGRRAHSLPCLLRWLQVWRMCLDSSTARCMRARSGAARKRRAERVGEGRVCALLQHFLSLPGGQWLQRCIDEPRTRWNGTFLGPTALGTKTLKSLRRSDLDKAVFEIEWRVQSAGHLGWLFGAEHSVIVAHTADGSYVFEKLSHLDVDVSRLVGREPCPPGRVHAVIPRHEVRRRTTLSDLRLQLLGDMRFNLMTRNCHHASARLFHWAGPNLPVPSPPNRRWAYVFRKARSEAPQWLRFFFRPPGKDRGGSRADSSRV